MYSNVYRRCIKARIPSTTIISQSFLDGLLSIQIVDLDSCSPFTFALANCRMRLRSGVASLSVRSVRKLHQPLSWDLKLRVAIINGGEKRTENPSIPLMVKRRFFPGGKVKSKGPACRRYEHLKDAWQALAIRSSRPARWHQGVSPSTESPASSLASLPSGSLR